jgi:murein DD-endopeptidase MepM/ murein hydrolase activator NlpD
MLENRKKIVILILLVMLSFIPGFLNAAKIDDLRAQIEDRNNQLAEIQREIEAYEEQLQEVGAEKSTLQNAIKALDINRNKLLADIRRTQGQIDSETLNIERLNLQISEKEKRIVENNNAIAEAIRRVRETDSLSMIESVLSQKRLSYFWETIEAIETFQTSIKEDLEKLKEVKANLANDVDEVEERRLALVSQRSQLNGKTRVIEQNKSEKNNLLSVTKNKEDNYKTLLEEKIEQREQFEKELFEFESQLQFELDPSKLPPVGKGVLAWPLDIVRITQKFGKTGDSGRLYRSGTHNGIDFGISTGSSVYSTLSGVVEGTGNTDAYLGCLSYGKWVLVRHNNGLSTLYAHLSLINVSTGQEVKTGQVIGFSGNTGYSTGPHLHLSLFASQGVRVMRLGDIPGRAITKCSDASIPIAPQDAYLDPLIYL